MTWYNWTVKIFKNSQCRWWLWAHLILCDAKFIIRYHEVCACSVKCRGGKALGKGVCLVCVCVCLCLCVCVFVCVCVWCVCVCVCVWCVCVFVFGVCVCVCVFGVCVCLVCVCVCLVCVCVCVSCPHRGLRCLLFTTKHNFWGQYWITVGVHSYRQCKFLILTYDHTSFSSVCDSYGTLRQLWHVMAVMAHHENFGSYRTLWQLWHDTAVIARYGSHGTLLQSWHFMTVTARCDSYDTLRYVPNPVLRLLRPTHVLSFSRA
jgi:hypothetical protein